jgi:5,10-methylene-tetrahydrofolate dehydrogenase/methenyl tetrahydrofolate cyclohydrolase
MKGNACKRLGIESRRILLPTEITTEQLIQSILDAGYNEGNIGDVDYDACLVHASAITPVPAGVGPVTIAILLKHTVDSADKQILSITL